VEIRNGSASILRRPPSELYENGGGVAGEKSIATVSRGWYHEGSEGFPFEANARLIAAAPELLGVAKHCEDMLMSYSIDRADGDAIADEALVMIRAAIAKATGAQP